MYYSSFRSLVTVSTLLLASATVLVSAQQQQPLSFGNTSFIAPVTVGQTWPVSFNAGNGAPVSIAFGNSSWAFTVVDGLTASGTFQWTVAVPVDTVAGRYQLALAQADGTTAYSPLFELVVPSMASMISTTVPTATVAFPAATLAEPSTTVTITAIYLPTITPAAIVTYIYWEEDCGCHKTSSCDANEIPAVANMSTTTVTYFEESCGCTKTVAAPCAPTTIPVSMVAPPPSNWTAPATNTPSPPSMTVPPAYTGAATAKQADSAFGVFVAAFIAVGMFA